MDGMQSGHVSELYQMNWVEMAKNIIGKESVKRKEATGARDIQLEHLIILNAGLQVYFNGCK